MVGLHATGMGLLRGCKVDQLRQLVYFAWPAVQAMSAIAASRGGFIGVLVDEGVAEWPRVRAEEQGF